MEEQTGKRKGEEMSFLEHLEELRWVLIRSAVAVSILSVIAFIYKDIIFDKIILAPKSPDFFSNKILCKLGDFIGVDYMCINSNSFQLTNITMSGQFMTHLSVSFFAGIIVAFPYILNQLWRFIGPALHENERKYARGIVLYCSLLFILGILFGYYVIVPFSINFLGTYSVSDQVQNFITLPSFMSTIVSTVLGCGLVFEFPIIVYFLSKIGVMTPAFMKKYRRHALIVILIVAAIITPPDVFSQIIVTIPLILLYEVSIVISKRIAKERERKENLAK